MGRVGCSAAILVAAIALCGAPPLLSQEAPDPGPQLPQGRLAPAEVQRLFDAYTLVQAQEALNLTDAQYGPFVSRMKALHETRRRHQQARAQALRELSRIVADARSDDAILKERLKALQDEDARGAAELTRAYAEIDGLLDIRQRVRFRLFEENMERRKFDLLMRARQGRAARGPRR